MKGGHGGHYGHGSHDMPRGAMQIGPPTPRHVMAYNNNLQTNPALPVAGKPTQFAFVITEQAIGDPLREFDLFHDRLMHLVIVSDDLALFDHVHPELEAGVFRLTHTFLEAGSYKLWADATPRGGERCLVAFRLQVSGQPIHHAASMVPDEVLTKPFLDGRYRVSLAAPGKVAAEKPVVLTFSLADSQSRSIRDLEPLMGAGVHCVVISQDARQFLHVHPVQEVARGWRGGPEVTFGTQFPTFGLYKVWGQFLHRGTVVTAAFVLDVK